MPVRVELGPELISRATTACRADRFGRDRRFQASVSTPTIEALPCEEWTRRLGVVGPFVQLDRTAEVATATMAARWPCTQV